MGMGKKKISDCNGFWGGLKNWEFFDILWNPNCPQKSDFFKKSDFLIPLKCLPKIRYNQNKYFQKI